MMYDWRRGGRSQDAWCGCGPRGTAARSGRIGLGGVVSAQRGVNRARRRTKFQGASDEAVVGSWHMCVSRTRVHTREREEIAGQWVPGTGDAL